ICRIFRTPFPEAYARTQKLSFGRPTAAAPAPAQQQVVVAVPSFIFPSPVQVPCSRALLPNYISDRPVMLDISKRSPSPILPA
ncbi:unnamed protein product, partial [Pylaiella littoralis]